MPTQQLPVISEASIVSEYPYTFRHIPHDRLLLDGVDISVGRVLDRDALRRYQRQQMKVRDRILKNGFQPLLFQPLIVNQRGHDSFAVGDGGGRYMAIQHWIDRNELPFDIALPCLVCEIPVDDEPMWFVNLNREKLSLSSVDIFLAQAAAGGEKQVDILRIVEQHGLRITKSGSAPRGIAAVEPLQQIYGWEHGRNDLVRTLRLLVNSGWADQPRGLAGGVIYGLALVVRQHNPDHTDDYVISALRAFTPNAAFAEATRMIGNLGGSSAVIGKRIYRLALSATINKYAESASTRGPARRGSRRWLDPDYYGRDESPLPAETVGSTQGR